MINLRYHIVSITAVFLALGIGLTLGSTFLDRVTVDNLEAQLTEVEADVRATNARNAELNDQVTRDRERDEALAEQLPERLAEGHLDDVPVLLIATEGTDEALVERAVTTLGAGGADVAGTWWATERWSLDDEQEIDDLGAVLGLTSDQPERLRRNAAIQLAAVLQNAAEPAGTRPDGAAGAEPDEGAQPALVTSLREAGFIEEETASGSGAESVLLPSNGVRYVFVSALPSEDPAQTFLQGLAAQLTIDGPAPVVAAQGRVELPVPDGEERDEEAERTTFVGALRTGEDVSERLSTLDDLDLAAGVAALILATEDVGDARTGHYGVGADATRLLPAPEAE